MKLKHFFFFILAIDNSNVFSLNKIYMYEDFTLYYYHKGSNWHYIAALVVNYGISNTHDIRIGPGNGLVPMRQQAITWTIGSPVHWRIFVAPGLNLLLEVMKLFCMICFSSTCMWHTYTLMYHYAAFKMISTFYVWIINHIIQWVEYLTITICNFSFFVYIIIAIRYIFFKKFMMTMRHEHLTRRHWV